MNQIRDWFRRHLSDPQIVSLLLLFLLLWVALTFFAAVFAPLLAAVVLAYLLEGPANGLERRGLPRRAAAVTAWLLFALVLVLALVALVPLLARQLTQIVQELPMLFWKLQNWLLELADRYPSIFSKKQMEELASGLTLDPNVVRQEIVARTKLVGASITYLVIYLVLVPLMVFFLLKDKDRIKAWLRGFLPQDISLISRVWADVDGQIANYVRGKVFEILIVWVVTFFTFAALGLNYSMLLGMVTGISVLVPYVGAVLVTIPVAVVAYTQYGLEPQMAYALFAYGLIQALDGNVLVPVLFSEANDLHPVAIIVAVLFFGGVWGFWGVFFAIPLATVVHAVLKAWPRRQSPEALPPASP